MSKLYSKMKSKKVKNYSRENILFLKKIEKKLLRARIPSALAEVESVVVTVGKIDRIDFFTGQKNLKESSKAKILKMLDQRTKGKPLSYLLNYADFYGERLYVDPSTLIPRPETEGLVEEVIRVIDSLKTKNPEVLDIGTGSGCIAISLTSQRPNCRMTALDISKKALEVARKNIKNKGLEKKVRLIESDLFAVFGDQDENFWDIIVSNPPYIPGPEIKALSREVRSEPRLALDGGKNGLGIIEKILEKAPFFLKSKGWLLMEIGYNQAPWLRRKVSQLKRYDSIRFAKDFAGYERVFIGQVK